jgi:hypothetical protein
VLKKVHNLRHRTAAVRRGTPFSECHSRLNLRLRDSQMIVAEFMDFFSTFAFSLMLLMRYR